MPPIKKPRLEPATTHSEDNTNCDKAMRYTTSPTADLDILKLYFSISYEDIARGTTIISADWDMHLQLSDNSGLKLSMRREGGRPGRVPGILDISHSEPGAKEWKRGRDVQYYNDQPLSKDEKRPFKVRDFFQFLVDEHLLRYTFEDDTHPFYWIFYVIYRLALDKRVVGGTSRDLVIKLDEANADLREEFATWNPVPQLDANVMNKPGTFA